MKALRLCTLVSLAAVMVGVPGFTAAQDRTENVVVAPVSESSQPGKVATRQQLDDQVRRFADRYVNRMSIAADRMRQYPLTPTQFELIQNWETMSSIVAVDIAIGSNAVTNLFDMMVLTTLGRMVIEQYWVPERFGEEYGRPLLDASRALEEDIWDVANAVLTSELQEEMRTMIRNYHDQYPDQVNPWWIRLNQFSGQRAARLNAIKRSGGMLKEVRRARETAEEMQEFAERTLFYLQRAPGIAFNTMETSTLQMLGGPQVAQMLEDSHRFIEAVEQLVQVFEVLPDERLGAIDQILEGLEQQRKALFNDLSTVSPDAQLILSDLRAIVESTERITTTLNAGGEPSEPIDIAEYRALTKDITQATIELTKLLDAVSGVAEGPEDIIAIADHVAAGQERVLNRLLVILLISIAFFFVCLFAYRKAMAKGRDL
jgi:hypothetical protein